MARRCMSLPLLTLPLLRPAAACEELGSAAALKMTEATVKTQAPGADTADDTLNLLTGLKLKGGTVEEWEFNAAIAGTVAMGIWKPEGSNFVLKCVDTLVVTAPGLQKHPGSCSFGEGDVVGIGCKGQGVVTMFGMSGPRPQPPHPPMHPLVWWLAALTRPDPLASPLVPQTPARGRGWCSTPTSPT